MFTTFGKNECRCLPSIAKLARTMLAVQATLVASESMNSLVVNMVNKERTQLFDDIIAASFDGNEMVRYYSN